MATYGKYLVIGTISAVVIIGGVYFLTRKQVVPTQQQTQPSLPQQTTQPQIQPEPPQQTIIPVGPSNSPPVISSGTTTGSQGVTTAVGGTPITQTYGITQGSARSASFSGDILFTNIAPPYIYVGTSFSLYPNIIGGIGTLSWNWDFGDGNTAVGLMVSHTYTKAGSYTIKLTVSDNYGNKGYFSTSLNVQKVITKITITSMSTPTITNSTLWWARIDYSDGSYLSAAFTTLTLETDIRLYTTNVVDLTGKFPLIY